MSFGLRIHSHSIRNMQNEKLMANYNINTWDLPDGKGEVLPASANCSLGTGFMEKVFTIFEYCILLAEMDPPIFKRIS